MKTMLFRVTEKIKEEFDLITEEEGLNTKTGTLSFLIKYYHITKELQLNNTLTVLDRSLDKVDIKKIPPIEDQLQSL